MAFKFKRLSDVEIAESSTNSTTVLIEEAGTIKRINKDKLGGGTVKSVNGVEPDASGNIEITASGAADWNQNDENGDGYIKNRTHYSNGFVEELIMPETELQTVFVFELYNAPYSFSEGDHYTALHNGVSYDCIVKYDNQYDVNYIGNLSIVLKDAEDTGEPFCCDLRGLYINTTGDHVIELRCESSGDTYINEFSENDVIIFSTGYANVFPKAGDSYIVSYDGIEYNCVAQLAEVFCVLGNASLIDKDYFEDTGEPFVVFSADEEESNAFGNTAGLHTFEVRCSKEDIKKLDPKYLPEGIGYIENISGELVPETTVYIEVEENYTELNNTLYLTAGNIYTVLFNGDTYECTAWASYEDCVCLGNGNIYGGEGMGEDVPFSFDSYSDGTIYLNTNEPGEYTISISGDVTKVFPIDDRLLPQGLVIVDPSNIASGQHSLAEGFDTRALGDCSHTEGDTSAALGYAAHAEGTWTIAYGDNSHAEGEGYLNDVNCHIEAGSSEFSLDDIDYDLYIGQVLFFDGVYALVEDISDGIVYLNTPLSQDHDINRVYLMLGATGPCSHSEGSATLASGRRAHAEGYETFASGDDSHAEGECTIASGDCSHAEGDSTTASGYNSHAEGYVTTALGDGSHAEGYCTEALGDESHAEGYGTIAYGAGSHAEGGRITTSTTCYIAAGSSEFSLDSMGWYYPRIGQVLATDDAYAQVVNIIGDTAYLDRPLSQDTDVRKVYILTGAFEDNAHSEGYSTTASGYNSHAEGCSTSASGDDAHAEGSYTLASGEDAHAEGYYTVASGEMAHAEGGYTSAKGNAAHAEGYETIASGHGSHVQGTYNIEDTESKYAHIVGNGTDLDSRSNAHTLDWEGNAWYQGGVQCTELILKSTDSDKCFKITVNDSGTLTATAIV